MADKPLTRRSLSTFTEEEIRKSAAELRDKRRQADIDDSPLLNRMWYEGWLEEKNLMN